MSLVWFGQKRREKCRHFPELGSVPGPAHVDQGVPESGHLHVQLLQSLHKSALIKNSTSRMFKASLIAGVCTWWIFFSSSRDLWATWTVLARFIMMDIVHCTSEISNKFIWFGNRRATAILIARQTNRSKNSWQNTDTHKGPRSDEKVNFVDVRYTVTILQLRTS